MKLTVNDRIISYVYDDFFKGNSYKYETYVAKLSVKFGQSEKRIKKIIASLVKAEYLAENKGNLVTGDTIIEEREELEKEELAKAQLKAKRVKESQELDARVELQRLAQEEEDRRFQELYAKAEPIMSKLLDPLYRIRYFSENPYSCKSVYADELRIAVKSSGLTRELWAKFLSLKVIWDSNNRKVTVTSFLDSVFNKSEVKPEIEDELPPEDIEEGGIIDEDSEAPETW